MGRIDDRRRRKRRDERCVVVVATTTTLTTTSKSAPALAVARRATTVVAASLLLLLLLLPAVLLPLPLVPPVADAFQVPVVALRPSARRSSGSYCCFHRRRRCRSRTTASRTDGTDLKAATTTADGSTSESLSSPWAKTGATTTRADFFKTVVGAVVATATAAVSRRPPAFASDFVSATPAAGSDNAVVEEAQPLGTQEEDGITVYKLPSGLKYVELREGTGPTPQYGQLVSIRYTSYIKLPASSKDPNPKPERYDSRSAFLFKHGNGRSIAGLDEGLHTLKVGGVRRLIVPPKLGYVDSGLGPIPEYPWDRYKLNKLLDDMIALKGGNVVMEVELLNVLDDEADQGYYQDESLSPEQFETLKNNLQRKAAEANEKLQQKQQAQQQAAQV